MVKAASTKLVILPRRSEVILSIPSTAVRLKESNTPMSQLQPAIIPVPNQNGDYGDTKKLVAGKVKIYRVRTSVIVGGTERRVSIPVSGNEATVIKAIPHNSLAA